MTPQTGRSGNAGILKRPRVVAHPTESELMEPRRSPAVVDLEPFEDEQRLATRGLDSALQGMVQPARREAISQYSP